MSLANPTQTVAVTSQKQDTLNRTISLLTAIDNHKASCKDQSCHLHVIIAEAKRA